ncbi:reticulon-3 isoform X3 [Corythoichthys intestinalis]|uniref:reticulon-3 isoform X3 n=1 Tax=Corythoichthys intestinalis TaxID=161448 RepID=UPI0025A4E5EE|nr:reticulon-3 isoform X3 [Corythoichthys intestinalis]
MISPTFSSPLLLSSVRGDADKKRALGSGKPSEGVATSLRFSSQPSSFWPDHYGGEAQPDSPVKMSPVSERIKALEALAAKKESSFRSDSFSYRHRDKTPSDGAKKVLTKSSPDQDSPESPFEVLGELRQMNEFEETETWMKAHLPPVPDFCSVDLVSSDCKLTDESSGLVSVSNAFAEPSCDAPKQEEPQTGVSVEKADFDLNFLPTAHVWVQPDKSCAQSSSQLDSSLESPSGSPPDDKTTTWTRDPEPAEVKEPDSSGESDETVIEDTLAHVVPAANSDSPPSSPETSSPDAERVAPPVRSERKLMQVPTINVIETEEPNCSDDEFEMEYEEEDHEAVDEGAKTVETAPGDSLETAKRRPLETEFMEGYSPPSSPVESDEEHAPQETIINPPPDAVLEKSTDQDSTFDLSLAQPANPETATDFLISADKEMDSPGNDDVEWSDEAQQKLFGEDQVDITACNDKDNPFFSRNSFMREDTYEGQSFEYEPSSFFEKDARDDFILDSVDTKPHDAITSDTSSSPHNPRDIAHTTGSDSDSDSRPIDSFVEFMRECLKTREGEEPDDSQSPQSLANVPMVPEEEQVSICALKELDNSQAAKEETLAPQSETLENSSAACLQQESRENTPGTYSEEVDAVDVWVAEAYHLAAHVLMSVLTHDSVKDLIYWRDPKKSGVVFGLSMLVLLSLAAFSVISVVSYLLLALLCVTITFRIYKSVVQAVKKSSDGHPFKPLLEKDVSISAETFRKHVDTSLTYINRGLKQMSRLFLVEDLVDSLKLAVVMWLLTYVGAIFNGITILILADILLFAVPPIYEKNKTQIDQYVDLARTRINATVAKLQEKLPGAVKRSKTE